MIRKFSIKPLLQPISNLWLTRSTRSYLSTVREVDKKVKFHGNILVLGCGAISSCALPILLDIVDVNPSKVTVIDMDESKKATIKSSLDKGVQFSPMKITPENRASILSKYLSPGDFLLDLAWEIDTCEQLKWCRENNVLFLNTSLEVWNPVGEALNNNPNPRNRTLFKRHCELRKMISSWTQLPDNSKGATALYEHGANPGLVSYLTKRALEDLTLRLLDDAAVDPVRKGNLRAALDSSNFAQLCYLTGTKVIHISERDTQISNNPKRPNEFLNTWSIEGYYEEAIAPVEICWGTHEVHTPDGCCIHTEHEPAVSEFDNPGHVVCLSQPGMRTWARSYVPGDGGDMIGMLIPHGEMITIGHHLTLKDNTGKTVHRPTINFVYCPTDAACASMKEVEARGFQMSGMEHRIMNEDIIDGQDKLGVLLLGHDYKAWWTGSLLSIHQARELVPGQNATSMQVAASAVAGVVWAMKNPQAGVLVADDVPYREVMPYVLPYLGDFVSKSVDWDPLTSRVDLYKGWNSEVIDESDPWQFCNFMVPGAPSCSFTKK